MLAGVKMECPPSIWWHNFCHDYPSFRNQHGLAFQELSKGIELFRTEEHRRDPFLLKICDLYGDEEEVRRLFKFLKSEHVGGDDVELFLRFAQFELKTGKTEKCLALLDFASKVPGLSQNEVLRKAIVEFKLLGTFRLDPLIEDAMPTVFIETSHPSHWSHETIGSVLRTKAEQPLVNNNNFVPPPTPMSQPTIMTAKVTPLPMAMEMTGPLTQDTQPTTTTTKDAVPSSGIKASEEQRAALSHRIRRLGLGPPKRAVVGVTVDSPNDSTVPRNVEPSPLPMVEDDKISKSPLNSPSKTMISPSNITERVKKHLIDSDEPIMKLKVVRINGKSYRVLAMIGKGGSSRVYKVLAFDNTIYALKKVNLRNLDDTTINGYINEINLLCSFKADDAPHIIRLIDHEVCKDQSIIYMLMEYGEADLSRLLRSKAKSKEGIDTNFIRYVWQQMLRAVQTVHAAKIVHCDLKPANFLLVGGTLKLIDFGISKAIMNDTTNIVRENQVGTVNYMSPEALQESNSTSERGRIKIGRASDVWSLGCILYEMVYGKPPFAQFSLIQRLQKILDPAYAIQFPALLGNLNDPALLDVVKGCLIRQAKRRLTLEELLIHQFLVPRSLTVPNDCVMVSKQQIGDLIGLFAKKIPNLDVPALANRIISQWQQDEKTI